MHDRGNPEVPGPLPVVPEDDEGWGEMDRLGVWKCVLFAFQGIEEIPDQHREAWALAMYRNPVSFLYKHALFQIVVNHIFSNKNDGRYPLLSNVISFLYDHSKVPSSLCWTVKLGLQRRESS